MAGLLEGEGYFGSSKKNNKGFYPLIVLGMTDSDVVYKAAKILGGNGTVHINNSNKIRLGLKESYCFRVEGVLAIQWMMTLYSLMGNRRQEKIFILLKNWAEYKSKHNIRGADHCKRGHKLTSENIKNDGGMICKTCYDLTRAGFFKDPDVLKRKMDKLILTLEELNSPTEKIQ